MILVLGSNGLLGHELMIESRLPGAVIGMDLDRCDITRPREIEAALDDIRPEWVINAAAYTDVDGCESNREQAWAVNATGAGNLAESCRKRDIPIVQISTDFVFDGRKGTEYNENDQPSPLSLYGESKWGGEQRVIAAGGRFLIVRTSWLFGKGGKNFPDTILKASRSSKYLRVVSDQVGSPTYARDLAEAIGELIQRSARGIVHVANRGHCSWAEYAMYIMKILGIDTEIIAVSSSELNRPAVRPGFSVLSLKRYHEITGKIMRSWQDAVGAYLVGEKQMLEVHND